MQYFCAGENESGKTTLMARLQGAEDPRRGYGLEYQYIDVKDDYRDGTFKIYPFFHSMFSQRLPFHDLE